jgi:hypothetical protein
MAQKKAESVPKVSVSFKVHKKTKDLYKAKCNSIQSKDFKGSESSVGEVLVEGFVSGLLVVDDQGKLVVPGPAQSKPAPPPPPLPPPRPEPELEPLPEILPPMPAEDYQGLNVVAYFYRNRHPGETYEQFLAAFESERHPDESIQSWAYRTRKEEEGGAA